VINLELIETIKLLLALVLAYLVIASITGAFQAWVADKMGDSTARQLGMTSLNPFVHVDPVSLIIMPIGFLLLKIVIGLSKPIPIMWRYIHSPWRHLKLFFIAISQALAVLILLMLLVIIRILLSIFAAKFAMPELIYAFQYVFELIILFSAWFIPYQLFLALTQIFFVERGIEITSSKNSLILIFLPLFGALLCRDISLAFIWYYTIMITKWCIIGLRYFVTI